ncbi:MAG: DNA methylase [Blautia sp.]|nr:DNA methylase [Blautia sp.]
METAGLTVDLSHQTTYADTRFSPSLGNARTYIAIDLKSYYASVECVYRGIDPLKANLLVADESRSDKTICLAVSPALKAIGVSSRPRLFEAKQQIRDYEVLHRTRIYYYVAPPRMAEYIRISSLIYSIYLKYVAPEDIHAYSIDECFIDATPYLHLYRERADRAGLAPAHFMAIQMIRDVLKTTGITATAGIGTNLYLAKVAMDIVAKKSPADQDGVRIASLNEWDYRVLLWEHRRLTDFWMIGPGTARHLHRLGILTMGDLAQVSMQNEEILYREFGIDAELMIDHAWGQEPCTMSAIKHYQSYSHSRSVGQVLPRPYAFDEARLVFAEMADQLACDLLKKELDTDCLTFWVSFDPKSLDSGTYQGPVAIDFYGRLHPVHTGGTVRLRNRTFLAQTILDGLLTAFDSKVDRSLLVRRLGVAANNTRPGSRAFQFDLFTDYSEWEKQAGIQQALIEIRKKYGNNAVLRGMNLLKGGTAIARNGQIGGHRA